MAETEPNQGLEHILEAAMNDQPQETVDEPQPDSAPKPNEEKAPKPSGEKEQKGIFHNKIYGDPYIWGTFIFLCIFSAIEVFGASSREIQHGDIYSPIIWHVMLLGSGFAIAFCTQFFSMKIFKKLTFVLIIITLGLIVGTVLWGTEMNGAKRWVKIAGLTLQPSEFAKLAAVFSIAYFMARNQIKSGGVRTAAVCVCAVIVISFGGLLFKEGLTNTALLMSISLFMMVISGMEWRKFILVIVFYGICGAGAFVYNSARSEEQQKSEQTISAENGASADKKEALGRASTWEARLKKFRDTVPEYTKPITDDNVQKAYSRMAQAHGGIISIPAFSRESSRLPLAFSDYIYSIIIEDWGLVGGLFVLFVYLGLLMRCGVLASKCNRAYPALLILGMAVLVVMQALFHIGINVGALPESGQPLPLISKGGTSIWIISFAFGTMLAVSRYVQKTDKNKGVKTKVELPEELQAKNPTAL